MSNHVQLLNNFEKLGLLRMREYFPNYQEVVNREAIPFTEALLELTNRELAFRSDRKVERAVENARFPVIRALKDFDFYFQPSINRHEILDLQHMGFLEKAENIITFLFPSFIGLSIFCEIKLYNSCNFISCSGVISPTISVSNSSTSESCLSSSLHVI